MCSDEHSQTCNAYGSSTTTRTRCCPHAAGGWKVGVGSGGPTRPTRRQTYRRLVLARNAHFGTFNLERCRKIRWAVDSSISGKTSQFQRCQFRTRLNCHPTSHSPSLIPGRRSVRPPSATMSACRSSITAMGVTASLSAAASAPCRTPAAAQVVQLRPKNSTDSRLKNSKERASDQLVANARRYTTWFETHPGGGGEVGGAVLREAVELVSYCGRRGCRWSLVSLSYLPVFSKCHSQRLPPPSVCLVELFPLQFAASQMPIGPFRDIIEAVEKSMVPDGLSPARCG